ncbi:sugar phosphate isomerase/epimerase family protein [Thermogutta sp.]|uniref:sugar phosphate isomerase/epimerase family protein n=1 Tax=Thermogutta sp. TaxID=1962930 RepID=UPI00321F9746
MSSPRLSRRRFLHCTGAALVGGTLCQTKAIPSLFQPESSVPQTSGTKHPVRLGGPIFGGSSDPEELARQHRAEGYRAAYCPGVKVDDRERLRAIRDAFAKNDVVIAEVGVWCNLLDVRPDVKAQNLQRVIDGLAIAEEVNARCCVNIAGSFNPEVWYGPHPKNLSQEFFDAVVENARKIIDAVKPKRAKFCYEMMGWALPDSPDSYLRMIKAVDRDAFGVHLDPCNLINCPERFYNNTALLNECFDKLGPWIASCHAKDLKWEVEMNIHFVEVPLGQGALDYRTYLTRLATLPGDVPLMMEHMRSAEEYRNSQKYLREVAQQVGISFE